MSVKRARELIANAIKTLQDAGVELVDVGEPPVEKKAVFEVLAPKSLLNHVAALNNAKRPIMEIYPSPSSKPSERIRYNMGDRVSVKEGTVKADGGSVWYEVLSHPEIDEKLFINADDGELLE
jgi:hypothetical protein